MTGVEMGLRARSTYPQVTPTAEDLMTRSFVVLSPTAPIGEALDRLGRRRRAGLAVARLGRGLVGSRHDTLLHARRLGLDRAPLTTVALDLATADPSTPEVSVRRRGADVVVVRNDEPIGVILREPGGRPVLRRAVADRLDAAPPQTRSCLRAAGTIGDDLGVSVAAVGGFVRDLLLGRLSPMTDVDLVVEGQAEVLAGRLVKVLGGQVETHPRFLTATLTLPDGRRLDVASARRERYERAGALPEVTASTLADDLARRDFTVNAIAVRVDGRRWGHVLDPLGGVDDLERRCLRVLHPLAFVEDPIRVFRAARLAVRLGFSLKAETRRLARAAVRQGSYEALSGERLRTELERVFEEPRPAAVLAWLGRQGVLGVVGPGYRCGRRTKARVEAVAALAGTGGVAPQSLGALRLLALGTELGRGAWEVWVARLRVPLGARRVCARTRDQETAIAAALSRTASPADAYLVLRGLPEVQVVWAGLTARSAAVRALVGRHLADWRRRAALLSGEDLRRLGVPQGPAVGSLLRGLVAAQVAGRVKDRAAAERWVRQRCAGQALAAGENTGELSGERGERVCPPSTSS